MNRVDALLDWAVGLPGKPAIRFEGRDIGFGELAGRIEAAATALAPRVGRGEVVALFCENTPEFVVAEYACFWLGAVVCPLNRGLTAGEVAEAVERLGVALVVTDSADPIDLHDLPVVAVAELPTTPTGPAPAVATMGPDDGALLLQTSGSTGAAKGVLLTYRNVVANYDRTPRWLGVTGADTLLITLPLHNTFGLNQGVNLMAVTGATLVLHRGFSPQAVVRALREDGITFFPAVPTMMTRLYAVAEGPITERAVRVGVGAAPTARAVVSEVWSILPRAHVFLGYGLSEATALVTLVHVGGRDRAAQADLDTCGYAVPGVELAVDEPDDTGLGEVLVRGDLVFDRYVGGELARPVRDGWLRTGDLGRLERGALTLADRTRDLIIRGGQNIYPGELERLLHGHPDVLEAAVVGRPDPDLGEVPVAYLVARPGRALDPDELGAFCARGLAGYKRPAELRVVAELPRGATGKISKPLLRELDASSTAG